MVDPDVLPTQVNDPDTDPYDIVSDAALRIAAYKRSLDTRPAFPDAASIANLSRFDDELPDHATSSETVLAQLDEIGSPATVASTGGRYFGFVTGGTDPAALGAAMLSVGWDQNIALPVMSPVAARLDALAAKWIVELLHLPTSAMATFCSGASAANLTAVLIARDALLHRAGWDVSTHGLFGAPPLRVVATEEIHVSLRRCLRFAGIGLDSVIWAPTDSNGRVTGKAIRDIKIDGSTLVLLQAGNVNTGHSDEFAEVIPYVHERGGWVHVDGAFGLWAAAVPELAASVAGVDLADSWATDAHKWLNTTYDSGIVICARPDDLRRAMTAEAAYVASTDDRALMQLGMQMSQRARGIEAWAVIASRGRAGLAEAILACHRHTVRFAELLVAGGATLLAPVSTNQALMSFGSDAATDAVITKLQTEGTTWAGSTTWKGQRALRLSVSAFATTTDDITLAAAAILRCVQAGS